jgi:hypothetical protein
MVFNLPTIRSNLLFMQPFFTTPWFARVTLCIALTGSGCMAVRPGKGISQGDGASSLKVIGGEALTEDQHPSVRRLDTFKRESWGGFALQSRCTMTFVRPAVALTAGHCVCRGDRFVYHDREKWEDRVATRVERHPNYRCGDIRTAPYDIALVWFDANVVNMPVSAIAASSDMTESGYLNLVGYGDDLLKITGNFWLGTRRVESERSKPSARLIDRERNGKRSAMVPWNGEAPAESGFIRVSAEFDVNGPGDVTPLSEFGGAGEGDSGGPAMIPESGLVIGVAALGTYSIQGIGSNRVKVSTDLVDLRRTDVRRFLRLFEIVDN